MDCFCEVELQYLSHTLVSLNEFELKATLLVRGEATQSIEKEVLLDIEEKELRYRRGFGVIYLFCTARRHFMVCSQEIQYNH